MTGRGIPFLGLLTDTVNEKVILLSFLAFRVQQMPFFSKLALIELDLIYNHVPPKMQQLPGLALRHRIV